MPDTPRSSILSYFEHRRDELVEDLSDLVLYDTPTGDAGRIGLFQAHLRRRLEAAGLACDEVHSPVGPHLIGELPGRGPALVLVAHADTVWPAGEPERRPPVVRDGRLWGPGVYDMKAGLALILWTVEYLRATATLPGRRLLVFVSADEEAGSQHARPVMDRFLPRDATALVPEPPCPDGSLKIARKGVGMFWVSFRGREVHAGVEPERGASAISEAARCILELERWRDPERGVLVNIGTIRGGTATNVVAGAARIGIDLRFDRPEDGEAFERRLRAHRPADAGVELEVTGGLAFPPLVPTPESRRLAGLAVGIAREELGLEIGAGSSGGGSDGSHLASRGLAVLDGLGVDGAGAHALEEHVVTARLPLRAAFLTHLVLALGRPPPPEDGPG